MYLNVRARRRNFRSGSSASDDALQASKPDRRSAPQWIELALPTRCCPSTDASGRQQSNGCSPWFLARVLTLRSTERSSDPATSAGPNGGYTGRCSHTERKSLLVQPRASACPQVRRAVATHRGHPQSEASRHEAATEPDHQHRICVAMRTVRRKRPIPRSRGARRTADS